MTWCIPSPNDQVKFLRNIQRLLAEGLFVASYKFALLHVLADLAVLKGDDTGAPSISIPGTSPPSSWNSTGSSADPIRSVARARASSFNRIRENRQPSSPRS